MERLGRWISGIKEEDPLKNRPLLEGHFVTYFSFSNEEKAYLSDVVSRETFMEIDRSEHDLLELADGKRTIREIATLIYKKYPNKYDCIASAEKEASNFFQILSDRKLIKLIDHG